MAATASDLLYLVPAMAVGTAIPALVTPLEKTKPLGLRQPMVTIPACIAGALIVGVATGHWLMGLAYGAAFGLVLAFVPPAIYALRRRAGGGPQPGGQRRA